MLILRSFVALALMAGIGFAESAEAPKFYKLDFVVKEIESGRVVTSRAYSMLVATDSTGSLRAGSKVPMRTSGDGSPVSFIDVGTNFDCKAIKESPQHDLSLFLTAEISSTVHDAAKPDYFVVRQNKWSSTIIVPVKKATVIFSSDDATAKAQVQLELTATPISD
jgi:hypothetical protein